MLKGKKRDSDETGEPPMKYRFVFGMIAVLLLAVLSACGGTSSSTSNQMNVTLSDIKIQSAQTTFTAGTKYHFVVTNNGKVAHEFMIMPMGMQMGNMSMDEMHKMALAMIDNVAPGETKTVDYTFTQSTGGQQLEV